MKGREHAQSLGRVVRQHRYSTGLSRRELLLTIVAIAVLQIFAVIATAPNDEGLLPPLMGFAATAALLWHRARLLAVVGAVGVLSLAALVFYPMTVPGVFIAALITVNFVSARSARRVSWATTAVFALLVAASVYRSVQEQGRASTQGLILAALTTCLVLGSWTLGQLRRARAQEVDAIRERMHQAEVGQAQAEQIAILTERTRIAQEMHDIIAHSVSGMVALADGGRYAAAADPDAAMRALGEISRGGRQALGELRGVIRALRDPSGQLGGPPPGIADVADLVSSTASRGLHVERHTEGSPRPVPASAGLAAYRVVQESLTNVVKHAGLSARATVTLTWRDDLTVEIRDDGGGLAPVPIPMARGGSGLIGMRERTEALSGTLEAGPRSGGGFSVRARIPLPAETG
jgi:signal transduction histidine kinase